MGCAQVNARPVRALGRAQAILLDGARAQTCLVVVPATSIATAQCSNGASIHGQMTLPLTYTELATTAGNGASESTMTLTLETYSVMAPMFQINYRASDLASITTGSPQSTRATGTSPTETNATAGSNAAPETDASDGGAGSGLSGGSIAGIAIGVAAVVMVLVLAAYVCAKRRGAVRAEDGRVLACSNARHKGPEVSTA